MQKVCHMVSCDRAAYLSVPDWGEKGMLGYERTRLVLMVKGAGWLQAVSGCGILLRFPDVDEASLMHFRRAVAHFQPA